MSLEDGIITTGVLNSEEQKTFTFHSKYDDSEKKVVTLVYTIIDNDQGSVGSFPEIQIGYVTETSAATSTDRKVNDRIIEKNIEVRRSSSSRVYKFVAKKALYLITLTMPKQLSSTYSLSININGLVSLPPNNEILGYLAEKSFDIYQINIQRAGNLLIQFYECFGNSSISIAKSRQDYLNNNFETSIQTTLQSSDFVIIQVPAGSVYLKVTGTKGLTIFTSLALDGNKALESAYKIAAYLIPSGHQIPQRMFEAGNQGKIEASTTDGKFHVKWDNLQLTNQDQSQSNIDIYETVYFSRSERALDMAAKCQLIPGSEFTFTLDHGEDMRVSSFSTLTNLQERVLDKEVELAGLAEADEGSSPLLVKITARVQPSAEESSPLYNLPVSVFYQKSEVSHKPPGSAILQRLKSILGNTYLASGLLVVIVGGVAWGCMKRRKQQQMIVGRPKGQYELSKVKDESRSESSPNPSPTKQLEYSDLQDDEEEEPVPEQDSVVGLKENKEEK
jgi:hypothetical protein